MTVDVLDLHFNFWPSAVYDITPQNGRTQPTKAPSVRPTFPVLDFSLLRNFQCVIDLDPKVSNSALQLGMTEQQLDCP